MITCMIVLYDVAPSNSKALNSVLSSNFNKTSMKIVIWNNGPDSLSCNDYEYLHSIEVCEIYETLENVPLSYIYNSVIDKIASDIYVILDHDTTVCECYFDELDGLANNIDANQGFVFFPALIQDDIIESPKYPDSVFNPFGRHYIFAAMSGTAINLKAVNVLKENFGDVFDSRFTFYGIDNVFCYNLSLVNEEINIVIRTDLKLEHSFSRNEESSPSRFRRSERAKDVARFFKYYFGIFSFFRFFRNFLKAVVSFDYVFILQLVKTLFEKP